MQGVNHEQLKALIEEAKKEGKDVSALEAQLSVKSEAAFEPAAAVMGQREEEVKEGKRVIIESTGPAREDDFRGKEDTR